MGAAAWKGLYVNSRTLKLARAKGEVLEKGVDKPLGERVKGCFMGSSKTRFRC